MYQMSPNIWYLQADSGHAGSASTASPPKSGPGGEDDLVDVRPLSNMTQNLALVY